VGKAEQASNLTSSVAVIDMETTMQFVLRLPVTVCQGTLSTLGIEHDEVVLR
jgi:hypothetical protein